MKQQQLPKPPLRTGVESIPATREQVLKLPLHSQWVLRRKYLENDCGESLWFRDNPEVRRLLGMETT